VRFLYPPIRLSRPPVFMPAACRRGRCPFRPGVGRGKNLKPALPGQDKTTPGRATSYAPPATTKRGRQFIAGFPLAPGTLSTGFPVIRRPRPMFPGAERGKEFLCTQQTLSRNPLYRAKMPSIATPVVNGNQLLTPCPLPHGKQGKNRKQSGAEGG
jgi:hypothetical protein